ncbi:MAG: YitT family protein [Bacilli bacterium]|jgi:uncharacterized membrane-anchored protein YitT (DUF2179 family)
MPKKNLFSKNFFNNRDVQAVIKTVLGSIIYSLAVVWLLDFGGFFAGGITGISQLIARFIGLVWGKSISLGLFVFGLNIPLLILGWKHISKKFAFLTLLSILTQTLVISFLDWLATQYNFQPFSFLLKETLVDVIVENGKVVEVVKENLLSSGNRLLLALIGGGVAGVGAALCLSGGGSSGGMDVIANSLFVRRNISFTKYSLIVDGLIILLSGFFGLETMLFTFVRLIVYMIAIDNLYIIYKVSKIEIITEKANELREMLLAKFHHGLTIYTVKGGYTLQEKYVLTIFVSSYEVNNYITSILECDPKAFVSVSSDLTIKGNFSKRTII